MASVVEQILARVETSLLAANVAGGNVDRTLQYIYDEDGELPAINIRRGLVSVQSASFENDQVTLAFTLALFVGGANVETAADALHVDAHAALMLDSVLVSLGRSTLRLTGTDNDADALEQPVYQLNCHYEIDAWVSRADLTQSV